MDLIEKTFEEVIDFSRPVAADYLDGDGQPATAGVNVPRFTHTTEGVPLGLMVERPLRESAVIRNGGWRNPQRGTWIIRGIFDNAELMRGLGFFVDASGSGTVVITYNTTSANVFARGSLQYQTKLGPVDDFGIATENLATVARIEFYPHIFSDSKAAAAAVGAVDVMPSLVTMYHEGESGFLWDGLPYYQDPAGTTVASWGDPVGLISDDSGNGADFTQATVTARPILRNDPPRLELDLVDDLLQTTLPTIENGTLVLAGTNGIWIDDDFNHAGGAFTVGPTTYTGGPVGILPVVGDLIVGGSFAIDRQLTSQERERVIRKLKSMGAPGVFELGPEMVVNGTFDTDISGWVKQGDAEATIAWEAPGVLKTYRPAIGGAGAYQIRGVQAGSQYLARCQVVSVQSGVSGRVVINSGDGPNSSAADAKYGEELTTSGVSSTIYSPVASSAVFYLRRGGIGEAVFDNASLRKLELIP